VQSREGSDTPALPAGTRSVLGLEASVDDDDDDAIMWPRPIAVLDSSSQTMS